MQKWFTLLLVALIVFAIDQIAKAWVVAQMVIGQTIEIIPPLAPYFQLTRTTNTGIAFGIFSGGNAFLLVTTSAVVMVLLAIYRTLPQHARAQQIGYAIIIGAALGNIIDRIRFGHVVDFVHIYIPTFISNVSNFADHFVIIGVIVILVDSFRHDEMTQLEKQKSQPADTDNFSTPEQLSTDV